MTNESKRIVFKTKNAAADDIKCLKKKRVLKNCCHLGIKQSNSYDNSNVITIGENNYGENEDVFFPICNQSSLEVIEGGVVDGIQFTIPRCPKTCLFYQSIRKEKYKCTIKNIYLNIICKPLFKTFNWFHFLPAITQILILILLISALNLPNYYKRVQELLSNESLR